MSKDTPEITDRANAASKSSVDNIDWDAAFCSPKQLDADYVAEIIALQTHAMENPDYDSVRKEKEAAEAKAQLEEQTDVAVDTDTQADVETPAQDQPQAQDESEAVPQFSTETELEAETDEESETKAEAPADAQAQADTQVDLEVEEEVEEKPEQEAHIETEAIATAAAVNDPETSAVLPPFNSAELIDEQVAKLPAEPAPEPAPTLEDSCDDQAPEQVIEQATSQDTTPVIDETEPENPLASDDDIQNMFAQATDETDSEAPAETEIEIEAATEAVLQEPTDTPSNTTVSNESQDSTESAASDDAPGQLASDDDIQNMFAQATDETESEAPAETTLAEETSTQATPDQPAGDPMEMAAQQLADLLENPPPKQTLPAASAAETKSATPVTPAAPFEVTAKTPEEKEADEKSAIAAMEEATQQLASLLVDPPEKEQPPKADSLEHENAGAIEDPETQTDAIEHVDELLATQADQAVAGDYETPQQVLAVEQAIEQGQADPDLPQNEPAPAMDLDSAGEQKNTEDAASEATDDQKATFETPEQVITEHGEGDAAAAADADSSPTLDGNASNQDDADSPLDAEEKAAKHKQEASTVAASMFGGSSANDENQSKPQSNNAANATSQVNSDLDNESSVDDFDEHGNQSANWIGRAKRAGKTTIHICTAGAYKFCQITNRPLNKVSATTRKRIGYAALITIGNASLLLVGKFIAAMTG
jgi:hypothetical protein